MSQAHDPETFDQQAISLLEKIKPVAERDESAASHGKTVFLSQAEALKATGSSSTVPELNQKRSKASRRWMLGLNPILTILILVLVVLGSSTTTVYAAQNSAPDQFLYPVKLASEDLRLSLASNPKDSIGMSLEFSNRRLEEGARMADDQKTVSESIPSRWLHHIHDLFEHSQSFDNVQMQQSMLQIQQELTQQLQTVDTLLVKHPDDPALLKLHSEILASQALVKNGLNDPQAFRQKIQTSNGKEIEDEMENESSRLHDEQEDHSIAPGGTPTPALEDTIHPSNTSGEQVKTQQDEAHDEVEAPQITTNPSSGEGSRQESDIQSTSVPNNHSETGDSNSSSENSNSSDHSETGHSED